MINETDLQKARSKSLVSHFKKAAAHHEKMADHHEKCMKAHGACAAHHEGMMGKDMAMATGGEDHFKTHHKTKMNFHKTMEGHHEKAMKLHHAHAEHHAAMAVAHGEDEGAAKAAFATLEVELEKVAAVPAVADPATPAVPVVAAAATVPAVQAVVATPATSTGDQPMSKTAEQLAAEAAAGATAVDLTSEDNPIRKSINDAIQEALKNGVKEILASPEFRKNVQEQVGNVMLTELGKQTLAPTPVRTFAVPRGGPEPVINKTTVASIASGATPAIDVTGMNPEFSHLVSMD